MNNDVKETFKFENKFKEIKLSTKMQYILLTIVTAILLFLCSYFGLVPINLHSSSFRTLIGFLLVIWSLPALSTRKQGLKNFIKNPKSIPLIIFILFVLVNLLFSIFTSPLFISIKYRELITVTDNHSFTEDVEDYTTMQIPVVDKYLAQKLGDKKLGEDNLGSQFNVGKYYMICHNNNLYWIAPIEFNGFFPWVNRKVSPGFVMVNANDPADVKIVKSELKYTDSAYLSGDLGRKNYFNNPTAWRAEDAHLELTDDGEPRFVETVYTNRFGYTNGTDVVGVIVTNPMTGESQYYDYLDAPSWINHVLTENIIIEQINYWGTYVNGFFNSMFAKNEILQVSSGINYVYSKGDLYLQTGMTSVGADESIVGVMMVNMRTKESFFYRIGGATEYAAAQSAIGKDQEKRYTSTDPIMINLGGVPTYFAMLKDDEGLVKRYAYINVKDYRLVSTAETKEEALVEYKKLINVEEQSTLETFAVAQIEPVITGGETYYYIKLTPNTDSPEGFADRVFRAHLSLNANLPFIKAGDVITISYINATDYYEINTLTL